MKAKCLRSPRHRPRAIQRSETVDAISKTSHRHHTTAIMLPHQATKTNVHGHTKLPTYHQRVQHKEQSSVDKDKAICDSRSSQPIGKNCTKTHHRVTKTKQSATAAAPNFLSARTVQNAIIRRHIQSKSDMIVAAAYHSGMSEKGGEEGTGALVAGAPQSHLAVAPRLTVDPIQHLHRVLLTQDTTAHHALLQKRNAFIYYCLDLI